MNARSPLPWSFTSLSDFKNCPKQFYEKRVIKSVKDEQGEEQIWGERVHKYFEDRQSSKTPLPPMLAEHEEFMAKVEDREGNFFTEQKIALNRAAQACTFFDKDVWFRGVIDYKKISLSQKYAYLVDYKTGKVKDNYDQLTLFALHTFIAHPTVDIVDVNYYWTKTREVSRKVYGRAEVKDLWAKFLPDLRQYKQAFSDDVWQPRPSGLCNGWCPVKHCEFWKPKRVK